MAGAQFEAILAHLAMPYAELEAETLKLGDALGDHFDAIGWPVWKMQLVLCYTLAFFACETSPDWRETGRALMAFFGAAMEHLAPILAATPADPPEEP